MELAAPGLSSKVREVLLAEVRAVTAVLGSMFRGGRTRDQRPGQYFRKLVVDCHNTAVRYLRGILEGSNLQ